MPHQSSYDVIRGIDVSLMTMELRYRLGSLDCKTQMGLQIIVPGHV